MSKVVASKTELFLQTYVAPALISKYGKVSVLLTYIIVMMLCLLKLETIDVFESQDLLVVEGFQMYDFIQIKNKYFDHQSISP